MTEATVKMECSKEEIIERVKSEIKQFEKDLIEGKRGNCIPIF